MVFLWVFPFSYGFLWFSYGFSHFPMAFLWFSYGFSHFPMAFLWFSYGFFPFSYGFPMVFLWFSHFPMIYHFPTWVCRCYRNKKALLAIATGPHNVNDEAIGSWHLRGLEIHRSWLSRIDDLVSIALMGYPINRLIVVSIVGYPINSVTILIVGYPINRRI